MTIFECSECGYVWKGKSEYECEVAEATDPCPCAKRYAKMSKEELAEELGIKL